MIWPQKLRNGEMEKRFNKIRIDQIDKFRQLDENKTRTRCPLVHMHLVSDFSFLLVSQSRAWFQDPDLKSTSSSGPIKQHPKLNETKRR